MSSNKRKINLLEFFYKLKYDNHIYKFINEDIYDFRKENLMIYHNYNTNLCELYLKNIYIQFNFKTNGYDAYIIKKEKIYKLD